MAGPVRPIAPRRAVPVAPRAPAPPRINPAEGAYGGAPPTLPTAAGSPAAGGIRFGTMIPPGFEAAQGGGPAGPYTPPITTGTDESGLGSVAPRRMLGRPRRGGPLRLGGG